MKFFEFKALLENLHGSDWLNAEVQIEILDQEPYPVRQVGFAIQEDNTRQIFIF